MPSWLLISYYLTVAFNPQNDYTIYINSYNYAVTTNINNSYSLDIGGQAEIVNMLRFGGSIKTYAYNENMEISFSPVFVKYNVSASMFYKGIEFGIKHKCDHPIVSSNKIFGTQGGNETSIFLTLKGQL